jgi:hypothetical protein
MPNATCPATRPAPFAALAWLGIALGLSKIRASANAICARLGLSVAACKECSSACTADSTGPAPPLAIRTGHDQRWTFRRVDRNPMSAPIPVALMLTLGRYADVAAATACVTAPSVRKCHRFHVLFELARSLVLLRNQARRVGRAASHVKPKIASAKNRPEPTAHPDGRLQ